MTIISGIIQGIIQGLTEFLPVSSSGHLSLFQHFSGGTNSGSLLFNLMLHLGTLAAVIVAYYEDLWEMLKELLKMVKEVFTRQFKFKTDNPNRKLLYMLVLATLMLVLVVPIKGVVGKIATDNDIVVEGVCFLITSGMLFLACKMRAGKGKIDKMKPRSAIVIGIAQGIATLPGISRSGATTAAGMILGFERSFVVKFSFLLGIPAILGGAILEIGDAAKEKVEIEMLPMFVGIVTAALVGYVCIRLVRWLVVTDKYIIFAWYTLALGVIVVVVGVIEHVLGKPFVFGQAEVANAVSNAASVVSSLPLG